MMVGLKNSCRRVLDLGVGLEIQFIGKISLGDLLVRRGGMNKSPSSRKLELAVSRLLEEIIMRGWSWISAPGRLIIVNEERLLRKQ